MSVNFYKCVMVDHHFVSRTVVLIASTISSVSTRWNPGCTPVTSASPTHRFYLYVGSFQNLYRNNYSRHFKRRNLNRHSDYTVLDIYLIFQQYKGRVFITECVRVNG